MNKQKIDLAKYCYKMEIINGNPLILKRISKAIDIPIENLSTSMNYEDIFCKTDDFYIRYTHKFVDNHIIDVFFKNLNKSYILDINDKLLDAMALEPEYDNIVLTDILTNERIKIPFDENEDIIMNW